MAGIGEDLHEPDECLTELSICKISFSSKDKGELYSSFLIGQDLQEDILTAICDRPDTWTRLLLNMGVLTIQVGVWKT